MFRPLRRQQLTQEDCIVILNRGSSGVLALTGDDGYPYAVPPNYVCHEGTIFFHEAQAGHKLDAITRDGRVSFCVTDLDELVPKKYTTLFRSVIVFGTVRILTDETEIRTSIDRLAARFRPGHEAERHTEIKRKSPALYMFALTIEHMTGKESIELARQKNV